MNSKNYWVAIGTVFVAFGLSSVCFSTELSLNGIVPAVSEAHGYGWTTGIPAGGYMPGNDVELYAGYWEPVSPPGAPHIATNALIFPSRNAVLSALFPTNISWYVDKITDDRDGTNVLIAKISVHRSDTSAEVGVVTNNIQNTLGNISWAVPAELVGSDTNYVLKFEVVNSLSVTNSRIFWDNAFMVVPEPAGMLWIIGLLLLTVKGRRRLVS
jgi:hypothetical protein